MPRMDEVCRQVAGELTDAARKVFDDVPNRAQVGEFFADGMQLVELGNEVADWPKEHRVAALLRSAGYLALGLSEQFAPLPDEVEG